MTKVASVFYNRGNGQYRNMKEEGFVMLSETILSGIKDWTDNVIRNPTKRGLEEALLTFTSREYAAVSMGHGEDALKDWMRRLDESCGRVAS